MTLPSTFAPRRAALCPPFAASLLALLSLAAACATGGNGAPDAEATDTGSLPDRPGFDAGAGCGDSVAEGTEECDGADLGGQSCTSLGYAGGELRCNADCTLDKTGCEEMPCGNGRIDTDEECDGADLGGASCASRGFVGGTLGCTGDCTFDVSDCDACGNGVVDEGEECDGSNLGGLTCADRGFETGTLACDASCGFDESGCSSGRCGNDRRDGREDCDGSDLGGADCTTVGLFAGNLGCNADCTFDIADCNNCGNGTIDGIEQCDGSDLGGADCTTLGLGFTMGTLGCTARCAYDLSGCATDTCGNGRVDPGEGCDDGGVTAGDGCSPDCAVETGWSCSGAPSMCQPVCGDGRILGGEECDGSNLGGASCTSEGFTGGTLACTACRLDTSGCTTTTCGNGTVDVGEECDDGNTATFDGCDSGCQVEPTFYLPVRLRNGDGSNHGMLEVLFEGAWRDVCDDTYAASEQQAMADIVCRQLGYTGTGHQFITSFGGGSGSPVMDDVRCTGTETSLAQCPFAGWNVENCGPSEAVGIRCMPGEGDIRLVDGPHGMEGRLQIFHSGAWGEVCDDYFDGFYSAYHGYSTTTVCQQLGYARGTFLSTYDAPSDTFILDDVNCTGTERRIGDCPHPSYGTENCFSTEGAGFRCETWQEGDARLVDGTARNAGRVEVLHGGVWGTVCDDYISTAGARQDAFVSVGCRELGFSGAGMALTSVPDGVDPTWLDDMNCSGSESRLSSCPNAGWGIENCAHFEDIGLSCTP